MRACAGYRYGGPLGRAHARSAGSGYCRARGGSRGLLPQAGAARLARQPLGEAAHAGRPAAALAAGTGHRDLSAQVTEDWRCLARCRCP